MVGIGKHAADLGFYFFGAVRQVDAVAQRFAHLGLAVGAGQAQAGRIVGEHDIRFHQNRTVDAVETADNLVALLQHGFLVFSHGNGGGPECRNVGRLGDGIGEETHGQAALVVILSFLAHVEAALGHFVLDGRIALEPLDGDHVHIVERQFGQFRNLALDEQGNLGRVQSHGQVIQGDLDHVLADFFGIVYVVGEGLRIGNKDEHLLIVACILELDAAAKGTHIMSDVEPSGRAVTG